MLFEPNSVFIIHKQHMLTNPSHKCTAGTQVIFAIHIQHPNHLYNKLITPPLQTLHEGVGIGRNNLSCIIDSKSNVQDSEKTPSKLMRCLQPVFSTASAIVTKKRSSLALGNSNMLIFLNKNVKHYKLNG